MIGSVDVAGAALTIGGLCFLVGAANPALFEVWTAGGKVQLQLIQARRRSWEVTNLLFAIATVLTASALSLVPDLVGAGGIALARFAVTAYGIGALLWLASIIFRLAVTPAAAAAFAAGTSDPAYADGDRWSGGLFAAFTVMAGLSLTVLGFAVLWGGSLPALVGWISVVIGIVMFGGYLVVGDMPPFVAYLPTTALGIALLLASR